MTFLRVGAGIQITGSVHSRVESFKVHQNKD